MNSSGPICEICGKLGMSCFVASSTSTSPPTTTHFGYINQCAQASDSTPGSTTLVSSLASSNFQHIKQSPSDSSKPASTPETLPSQPASPPIKVEDFNEIVDSQLASQNHIPRPRPVLKDDVVEDSPRYRHRVRGMWWYRGDAKFSQMSRRERIKWSHIGRIMETDFGEEYEDKDRCVRCRERGYKCWGYSERAHVRVNNAPGSCTRCLACNNRCSNTDPFRGY